jgi:hypothetical protein
MGELRPGQLLTGADRPDAARGRSRRKSPFRSDFADADEWTRLARLAHVRLSPWGEPAAATAMRAFLKLAGVVLSDYLAWAGEDTLDTFGQRNAEWPLRAWMGLVLERWPAVKAKVQRPKPVAR